MVDIQEACALFTPPLDNYEMFWEKSLDTKSLLAWNRDHIILCFRGTASLSNVKADAQVYFTAALRNLCPLFLPQVQQFAAISSSQGDRTDS